jgi:hypothetical protein
MSFVNQFFNFLHFHTCKHFSLSRYAVKFPGVAHLKLATYTGEYNADLASRLYGIYRTHSIRLMKLNIHENKGEVFESIALQAISILFQASKKKTIHNLIGYYDGIFRELIDKALFSEAFMDYDVSVEMKKPVLT